MGAEIDRRDAEIERVEERRGTEDGDADDPERDGRLGRKEERCRHAKERDCCEPEREKVQLGKGHFARANLQRKKIVSEASLRRGGEHQKNHQRTMERSEGGKAIRQIAKAGEERETHSRPGQMDAQEQRHGHTKEDAEEREPQIVEADGLVVGGEDVAGQ